MLLKVLPVQILSNTVCNKYLLCLSCPTRTKIGPLVFVNLPLDLSIVPSTGFPNMGTFKHSLTRVSLVAQLLKNLPAMRETWVQSLGWEDPLKKGKATHSSILA